MDPKGKEMQIVKDTFCSMLNNFSQDAENRFGFFFSEIQRVASEYNLLEKIDTLELVCMGNTYRDIAMSHGKIKQKDDTKIYYFFASCSLLTAKKEKITETIQHELMHIKDMVDEEFKYNHSQWQELHKTPELEAFIIVIWNIYVDSRLLRMGKVGIAKEQRFDELLKACLYFSLGLTPFERRDVFEHLWGIERIDFPNIISKAKEFSEMK